MCVHNIKTEPVQAAMAGLRAPGHLICLLAAVLCAGWMLALSACTRSAAPPPPRAQAPSVPASETPSPAPVPSGQAFAPPSPAPPVASPESLLPAFPWPPPPPSSWEVIPRRLLVQRLQPAAERTRGKARLHLRDLGALLAGALRHAGYEHSYYAVPDGFALVARLERITPSGAPYPPRLRFDPSFHQLQSFSLEGYLQALFLAPPGYYRVIVFIVSATPFTATGKPVSADQATAWLEQGANVLPAPIGALPYSAAYACTAMVYEFEKRDTQSNPVELHPGRLTARVHLAASGIAEDLWKQRSP